jgi:hypothetical protein
LKKRNRTLEQENEILRRAAAFTTASVRSKRADIDPRLRRAPRVKNA